MSAGNTSEEVLQITLFVRGNVIKSCLFDKTTILITTRVVVFCVMECVKSLLRVELFAVIALTSPSNAVTCQIQMKCLSALCRLRENKKMKTVREAGGSHLGKW